MMLHFQGVLTSQVIPAPFSQSHQGGTRLWQRPGQGPDVKPDFLPVWVFPTGQPPLENSSNPTEPNQKQNIKTHPETASLHLAVATQKGDIFFIWVDASNVSIVCCVFISFIQNTVWSCIFPSYVFWDVTLSVEQGKLGTDFPCSTKAEVNKWFEV